MKMKRTAAVLVLVTSLGDQLARAQNSASPQGEAPSDVIQGVLQDAPTIAAVRASRDCVPLPAPPADERLLGPHGDSLISTRCDVLSYEVLDGARPMAWSTARYRWTSVFTAEDKTRGPAASDNATEDPPAQWITSSGACASTAASTAPVSGSVRLERPTTLTA